MQGRYSITVLMLLFVTAPLLACNICGGNTGSIGLGLLANYNQNIIRLDNRQSRFNTQYFDQAILHDRYQDFGLSLRLGLSRKWVWTTQANYSINVRSDGPDRRHSQGFGDVLSIISYKWIETQKSTSGHSFYLETGMGLSLPTGKYNADIYADETLPSSFNAGRGAASAIGMVNAVWTKGRYGCVLNQMARRYGSAEGDYRFGSQYTTTVRGFAQVGGAALRWTPTVGLSYEHIDSDLNRLGNKVSGTGGQAWLTEVGIHVQYSQWQVGLRYGQPLKSDFASGEAEAKGRISTQLTHFF